MSSFKRLIIYNTFKTTTIQWEMSGKVPIDSTFQAFWSRDPGGTWTSVGNPAVDINRITDPVQHLWHTEADVWYKVNLVTPNAVVVTSQPTHVYNGLTKHYWLRWQYLLKGAVMLSKRGLNGKLRRRRWWGTPCPDCLDYDTGLPTKENCTTCFGTKYTGGYWPAVNMDILVDPVDRTLKEGETGPEQTIIQSSRLPAISLLSTDDIWIDTTSGKRWRVDDVKDAISVGSMPVVYRANLYEIRPTDVIYELI